MVDYGYPKEKAKQTTIDYRPIIDRMGHIENPADWAKKINSALQSGWTPAKWMKEMDETEWMNVTTLRLVRKTTRQVPL
jgi:hypothetical protein